MSDDPKPEPQKTITLTYYTAKWCQPCQAMKPILASFAEAHPDVALITLDVETTKGGKAADGDRVQSIPTMIMRAHGKKVWRVPNTVSRRALETAYTKAKAVKP